MDDSYISHDGLPSIELGDDSPEPGSDLLPFFNIEKRGDPRIEWEKYYDFVVTRSKAYYEFQSGYLPTEQYPQRLKSDRVTFNGKKCHPCDVPGCNSEPFIRHADLERHFRTVHKPIREHFYCDYPKCLHKEPFRKDHLREHYREYHKEDLLKRRGHTSRTHNEEAIEEFLASRQVRNFNWWRCSKCLQRVQVGDDEYKCPPCNIPCEQERIEWRKSKSSVSTSNSPAKDLASTFSQPGDSISGLNEE